MTAEERRLSAGANAIKSDWQLSVLIDGHGSEGAYGRDLESPNALLAQHLQHFFRSVFTGLRYGALLAVVLRAPGLEESMKLSREFQDEQQAEARELLLRSEGYQAWRKHAPDGTWHVIWMAEAREIRSRGGNLYV